MIKQYLLYLLRWQSSSLILAPVLSIFSNQNIWKATIIANLIGGLLFFWIDKYIFKPSIAFPLWQIQEEVTCVDCGKISKGFRLVKSKNYDRTKDQHPEFRCDECSKIKLDKLKSQGIEY